MSKFEDLMYDIRWEIQYYWRKLRGVGFDLVYGVRNIFEFMPLVWRDRDWDQEYLLILMKFKFDRMSKLHANHGHFVRSDHTAKQLRIMAKVTQRLIDDKFNKAEIDAQFDPNVCLNDLGKVINDKAFARAVKKADTLRREHKEYLFKLICKHLDKLWD
jgi:hypothetical protein